MLASSSEPEATAIFTRRQSGEDLEHLASASPSKVNPPSGLEERLQNIENIAHGLENTVRQSILLYAAQVANFAKFLYLSR